MEAAGRDVEQHLRALQLEVVELPHLVGSDGIHGEEGGRRDARVLHAPPEVFFQCPETPQTEAELFLLGLELDELGQVGLLIAREVEEFGPLALLVNDGLQAVNVGLDLDELGLDEFVGFRIDLLPRSGRILDVPFGQGVEEFDGPFRPNVVDLQLQDARLAHATDGQSTAVLPDDLTVVADLEALPLGDGLFDGAPSISSPLDDELEIGGLDGFSKAVLGFIHPPVLEQARQDIPLFVQNVQVEVHSEGAAAELFWIGFHIDPAQSAHGERPHPPHNEVGDVVVEVVHSLGHEVAAFQDAHLVGDVRTLSLETAADDALHHFSGLVVLVLLFEQDLRTGAVLVELLVRQDAGIPISQDGQQDEQQPVLGRHLQGQPQLLQVVVSRIHPLIHLS